jgi:hypothetical protein
MSLCKTLSLHIHTNFGSCQSLSFSVLFLFLFLFCFCFPPFYQRCQVSNELQKLRSERESKDHPTSSVYSYRKKKERIVQLFMSDPSISFVLQFAPWLHQSHSVQVKNSAQDLHMSVRESISEPHKRGSKWTSTHTKAPPRWMEELMDEWMDGWMNEWCVCVWTFFYVVFLSYN